MRFTRLVLLSLLSLAILPTCLGAVNDVSIYPRNVEVGDKITLTVVASPDEQVPFLLEFDGTLAVSGGEYYIGFNDVELTSSDNRLRVIVNDVVDLDLSVKYGFVRYITRETAVDGSASIVRSDAPIGNYDLSISGHSEPGVGGVPVNLLIECILTMDSNGEYLYTLDTDDLPVGIFSFDVDGYIVSASIEDDTYIIPPNLVTPSDPPVSGDSSPEEIADEMESYSPEEMEVLFNYTLVKAASILENLSVSKAVEFVSMYNSSLILELVNSSRLVEIVTLLDNVTMGVVLNDLSPETVVLVLLEGNYSDLVPVVISMVSDDVVLAAHRVEHVVKHRNNESDPLMFNAKTVQLNRIFTQLGSGTLVSLFESIAALPNTPSTVATLLEIMGVNSSVPIVRDWVISGDQGLLGLVFGYLSTDFGAELYQGVDDVSLFPLLSNASICMLPESTSMRCEAEVSPSDLVEGEIGVISLFIEESGSVPGYRFVEASLDGEQVFDELVILYPGETRTFFYESEFGSGIHLFEYPDGDLDFFVSSIPTPADIRLTDLVCSSDELVEGDELSISLFLTNRGESDGVLLVNVSLDGDLVYSESLLVEADSVKESHILLSELSAGSHLVEVNDESFQFVVASQPSQVPMGSFESVLVAFSLVYFMVLYKKRAF